MLHGHSNSKLDISVEGFIESNIQNIPYYSFNKSISTSFDFNKIFEDVNAR